MQARMFLMSNKWSVDPQTLAKYIDNQMAKDLTDKYFEQVLTHKRCQPDWPNT